MNPAILRLSFVFALPLSLVGAGETAMLLIGNVQATRDEGMRISGGAKVILKAPADQTTVTADEIVFDAGRKLLVCTGDSVVVSGGRTLKAKDITIELGTTVGRVLALNRTKGQLQGEAAGVELGLTGSQYLPSFSGQFPEIGYSLRESRMPAARTPASIPPLSEPRFNHDVRQDAPAPR